MKAKPKREKWTTKIAAEHRDADARCGRDWYLDGCACGACRIERLYLSQRLVVKHGKDV